MLHILRGKVKFFLFDKGYGFITPDDGGPDVWFHYDFYSGLSEHCDGELKLEFDTEADLAADYRPPQKGEPIVYRLHQGPKGPMAVNWLYPATLEQAEKALADRPDSPDNPLIKVMRLGPEELAEKGMMPKEIWAGHDQGFRAKLDEGFPEMFDEHVYVLRMGINGKWSRMWHPTDWHPKYTWHPIDLYPKHKRQA